MSLNCWICKSAAADSGEHESKRSDLKAVFGHASPQRPLYMHDSKARNRRVQSLDASRLKWTNVICGDCNSARTQPHDEAWETLHAYLRRRVPSLKPGDRVCGNSVFPHDTAKAMLNVHLYFAKAFGCTLVMENAPIDIAPFGRAIMTGTPHPDFYLNFGITAKQPISLIQTSPINVFWGPGGMLIHATWFYNVGGLVIEARVLFGASAHKVAAKQHAWHPRLGTNCLQILQGQARRRQDHRQGVGCPLCGGGSVQPTGDQVRVNAQLIDAESSAHLWAEQFDTPRADLLQTQDEMVTRLARSMYLQLAEVEAARLKRTPAANPDAEDLAL